MANKEKTNFREVKNELMSKMPQVTDYAFTVMRKDGDVVCVSENEGGGNAEKSPYKPGHYEIIPSRYKGWRIIKLIVPIGYIKAFYSDKKEE